MIGWASRFGTALLLALTVPTASCTRAAPPEMVAHFVAEDGRDMAMTVHIDGAGRWRVKDWKDDVTIARDGGVFVITHETPSGPALVIRKHDLDAAAAARQAEIDTALKLPPPPPDAETLMFDTVAGERQVVGRWSGTHYVFRARGFAAAAGPIGDMVLSNDPALVPLGRAIAAFLAVPDPRPKMLAQTNIDLKLAELAGKGCLIRFSGLRLDAAGPGPVDARLFDLPGAPLSRAAVDDLVRRRMPIPDLSLIAPTGRHQP